MKREKAKEIWLVIQDQAFIAGLDALCDGEPFKSADIDKFVDMVDQMIDSL